MAGITGPPEIFSSQTPKTFVRIPLGVRRSRRLQPFIVVYDNSPDNATLEIVPAARDTRSCIIRFVLNRRGVRVCRIPFKRNIQFTNIIETAKFAIRYHVHLLSAENSKHPRSLRNIEILFIFRQYLDIKRILT